MYNFLHSLLYMCNYSHVQSYMYLFDVSKFFISNGYLVVLKVNSIIYISPYAQFSLWLMDFGRLAHYYLVVEYVILVPKICSILQSCKISKG